MIEFDDLALFGSRADLEREIEHQRAALAEESERRLPVQSESARLRSAALHHMERSYELAREEFERWKILTAEGLVARVDFEKKQAEFAAVTRRLEEARAASREAAPAPAKQSDEPAAPDLRRAERLLVRLNGLPDTFLVRSPWNGMVRAIHVGEGEIPDRGAPLVTVARAALGRVEADVGRDLRVVEVRSACGVPGPLPFDLRDGTLSLVSPSPRLELGQRCLLAVAVRSRQGSMGTWTQGPRDDSDPRTMPLATSAADADRTGETLGGVISTCGLRKTYVTGDQQIHAVNGMDSKVRSGRGLALMGPSSTGKPTHVNLSGALDSPGAGNNCILGTLPGTMSDYGLACSRKRQIAFDS